MIYLCERENITTSLQNRQLLEQATSCLEWGSLFIRYFINSDIRESGFVLDSLLRRHAWKKEDCSSAFFEMILNDLQTFLFSSTPSSPCRHDNIYEQFTPHEIYLLLPTLWCVLGETAFMECVGPGDDFLSVILDKAGESWRCLVFEIARHFEYGMVCCVLGFRQFCSIHFQVNFIFFCFQVLLSHEEYLLEKRNHFDWY